MIAEDLGELTDEYLKFLKIFRKSAKILELVTCSRFRDEILKDPILKSKLSTFKEYNCSSPRFLDMGINERGVILRRPPRAPSLMNLKNEQLKLLLTGTTNPIESDIEDYFSNHSLHIGYMHPDTMPFRVYFIHLIVQQLLSAKKNIDICLPKLNHNVKLEQYIPIDFLIQAGISKVKIVTLDHSGSVKITEFIVPAEKNNDQQSRELRLIDPFPLAQKDMKILMTVEQNQTPAIVGCTGDDSFIRTVCYDKIPFPQVRNHKLALYKSFINVIDRVVGDCAYKKYFEELISINTKRIPDEQLGSHFFQCRFRNLNTHLNHPEIQDQAKKVAAEIRNNYSFEKYLIRDLQIDMLLTYKQDFILDLNERLFQQQLTVEEVKQKILAILPESEQIEA